MIFLKTLPIVGFQFAAKNMHMLFKTKRLFFWFSIYIRSTVPTNICYNKKTLYKRLPQPIKCVFKTKHYNSLRNKLRR